MHHSLTKAASGPLFARVRRTRLKETTKNIIFEISMLDNPIRSLEFKLIQLFLKFVYFMKTTTINIHLEIFLLEIRSQNTCLPLLTFVSKSLGSF